MAHSITIYSTPTCVYCRMAKEYFKKHDVAYTEHDVASDLAARKDMFDKSHQMGVPVIDIGGTIIVGFDQRAIDQALGAKN